VGVIAYYSIKYYIRFYCQLVVYLIVDFCFTEYIKLLKGVHHLAFVSNVNSLHYVFHWADGVPIFYKMLGKTKFKIRQRKLLCPAT